MKIPKVALLLSAVLPGFLCAQDSNARSDIESEIPLAKAVEAFNQKYPDENPLTEAEVIAAVRTIKLEDPEIPDSVFNVYRQVIEKKVLPRGMYFSRMTGFVDGDYHFDVDWKDLTLTSLTRGRIDPNLGVHGYNYRIRARFISSRELTANEKAEREKQLAQRRKAIADREKVEQKDGGKREERR